MREFPKESNHEQNDDDTSHDFYVAVVEYLFGFPKQK